MKDVGKSRFSQAPALHFLEKNIFRYRKNIYKKAQDEICMFSAVNPQKEMEEAARRIARLVREKGCRYGEIAVITGNLEEYGNLAKQVFTAAGIPYFIDEKHTVLMNPFVEYFRAALEMAVQDFSYESVFRYLRCGMSCVTREELRNGMKCVCVFTGECRRKAFRGLMRSGSGSQMRPESLR